MEVNPDNTPPLNRFGICADLIGDPGDWDDEDDDEMADLFGIPRPDDAKP